MELELSPDLLMASPTRSRLLLAEAWLVPSRLSLLVCCVEDYNGSLTKGMTGRKKGQGSLPSSHRPIIPRAHDPSALPSK